MRRALASMAPILARIEANERRQIADQAKNDGKTKIENLQILCASCNRRKGTE